MYSCFDELEWLICNEFMGFCCVVFIFEFNIFWEQ